MITIQPNLLMFENIICNIYLLVSPEGLTMVDCGYAGKADKILAQLAQAGYAAKDIHQVVITHAHNDHAGSAAEIIRRTGAKVLAYKDEVPYLERTATLAFKSRFQGMFFWLIEKIKPIPAVKVDLALAQGEVIPATGGYIVVHAPGHTPGSMCLYHTERRILISSDALFNMNPFTGKKGLIVPPGLVTADLPQALDSVRKLAGLEVEVLLCGHGDPILEKAGERIQKLVS